MLNARETSKKQLMTYLLSSCKWMAGKNLGEIAERQKLLRATYDRKLWRGMITNLKGYGTDKKAYAFLMCVLPPWILFSTLTNVERDGKSLMHFLIRFPEPLQ